MSDTYAALIAQIADELRRTLLAIDPSQAQPFTDAILAARRIIVAGKGRSGFQMRGFAMRLMHLGLQAYFVDDVVTPNIAQGDLLVIGSGSGKTPSLLQYAQRAKHLEATVALVTIAPTSPIGSLADLLITIPASTPKLDTPLNEQVQSIQPMGALFEQTLGIFLDSIIITLMEPLQETPESMFKRHANLE